MCPWRCRSNHVCQQRTRCYRLRKQAILSGATRSNSEKARPQTHGEGVRTSGDPHVSSTIHASRRHCGGAPDLATLRGENPGGEQRRGIGRQPGRRGTGCEESSMDDSPHLIHRQRKQWRSWQLRASFRRPVRERGARLSTGREPSDTVTRGDQGPNSGYRQQCTPLIRPDIDGGTRRRPHAV